MTTSGSITLEEDNLATALYNFPIIKDHTKFYQELRKMVTTIERHISSTQDNTNLSTETKTVFISELFAQKELIERVHQTIQFLENKHNNISRNE